MTLMHDDLDWLINRILITESLRTAITAKLNTTNRPVHSASNFGNCVTLTVLLALDHLVPEGVLDPTTLLLDTTGPSVHLLQIHL